MLRAVTPPQPGGGSDRQLRRAVTLLDAWFHSVDLVKALSVAGSAALTVAVWQRPANGNPIVAGVPARRSLDRA